MQLGLGLGLIGGGEHARVVGDVVLRLGIPLRGCWAPTCTSGLPRLGDDADLLAEVGSGSCPALHLALAGQPGSTRRSELVTRLRSAGSVAWIGLRHPSAIVASSALLEPGSFVGAGAIINPGAVIRCHAIVNTGAIIEHDALVEEGAHVGPGVRTGGGARVGPWATIGLGAVVRDHVSVGARAVVGMGAVVIRDVPEGEWVVGNPARQMSR